MKELTLNTNTKIKNNCEKAFFQHKKTLSQIFLEDLPNFKNVCSKNTSEWLLPMNLKQKQATIIAIAP